MKNSSKRKNDSKNLNFGYVGALLCETTDFTFHAIYSIISTTVNAGYFGHLKKLDHNSRMGKWKCSLSGSFRRSWNEPLIEPKNEYFHPLVLDLWSQRYWQTNQKNHITYKTQNSQNSQWIFCYFSIKEKVFSKKEKKNGRDFFVNNCDASEIARIYSSRNNGLYDMKIAW